MKELFVDINVVLEIILGRKDKFYCLGVLNQYQTLCLSPTSIHVIYYFSQKYGISFPAITDFVSTFKILNFDEKTFKKALEINTGFDFEDALQVATALENKVITILSLDQKMKQSYQHLISFV